MSKTLIVEDNRFSRDTLKELLTRSFSTMTVEQVSSSREALGKIESFHPDLVITDIRLPDGSGLELTRTIKNTFAETRVLILTGHHYPEYKEKAIQEGADGFFVKGDSSEELVSTIASFFPNNPSREAV